MSVKITDTGTIATFLVFCFFFPNKAYHPPNYEESCSQDMCPCLKLTLYKFPRPRSANTDSEPNVSTVNCTTKRFKSLLLGRGGAQCVSLVLCRAKCGVFGVVTGDASVSATQWCPSGFALWGVLCIRVHAWPFRG